MTSACYWTQFVNILLTTAFVLMCLCKRTAPFVMDINLNRKLGINANMIHNSFYKFYHPFWIFLALEILFLVLFCQEFTSSDHPHLYGIIIGLSCLMMLVCFLMIMIWNLKTNYPTIGLIWPRGWIPLGITTISAIVGSILLGILIANEVMVVVMLS